MQTSVIITPKDMAELDFTAQHPDGLYNDHLATIHSLNLNSDDNNQTQTSYVLVSPQIRIAKNSLKASQAEDIIFVLNLDIGSG